MLGLRVKYDTKLLRFVHIWTAIKNIDVQIFWHDWVSLSPIYVLF